MKYKKFSELLRGTDFIAIDEYELVLENSEKLYFSINDILEYNFKDTFIIYNEIDLLKLTFAHMHLAKTVLFEVGDINKYILNNECTEDYEIFQALRTTIKKLIDMQNEYVH